VQDNRETGRHGLAPHLSPGRTLVSLDLSAIGAGGPALRLAIRLRGHRSAGKLAPRPRPVPGSW